jgi:hypothetical protein
MKAPATSRRFLIVGMQRSGTTVTHARLAAHAQVALHPQEIHCSLLDCSVREHSVRGGEQEQRTKDLLEILDSLASPTDLTLAHGLKTALPDSFAAARFVGCLSTHAPGVAVIAVHRRDLVAQFASLLRAQASGQWHRATGEAAASELQPLEIDRERLRAYVESCVRTKRLLHAIADRPILHLDYEDDVVTKRDWGKVTAFLGIEEQAPLVERLQKTSPDPRRYVVDYEGLREVAQVRERECLLEPCPEPILSEEDSRTFLLHHAAILSRRSEYQAASAMVFRAMSAPPTWGIQDHRWASGIMQELVNRAGNAQFSRSVLERLRHVPSSDEHVEALCRMVERACID